MASPVQTPAGLLFAATATRPAYLSRDDHRSFARGPRNKWSAACPPQCEYDVFCAAEASGWRDGRPQLWGLRAGLPEIGQDRECLAKFPDPSNRNDAWHGYPVSALDPKREFEHRPRPALVGQWRAAGLIDQVQESRINRGKV